jgi:ATP-dependent DNA helicase RecG
MDYYLDSEVGYLKGVGPKWGDVLQRNGIYKILDLIEFFPRAYEDRRAQKKIALLQQGERAFVMGEVVHFQVLRRGFNKQFVLTIKDETGYLFCKFFRMPYRTYFEKFSIGKKVLAFGQVSILQSAYSNRGARPEPLCNENPSANFHCKKEFNHPELILIEELKGDEFAGLLPIYTEKGDLNSKKLHKWIISAISFLEESNRKNKAILSKLEFLPSWILQKYQLLDRWTAFKQIHAPNLEEANKYFQFRAAAQRRFIFEDFFWLELNLLLRKLKQKQQKAYIIKPSILLVQKFEENLPFQLTADQNKAFTEIQNDFSSGQCMQRLLQGDVGSGKTAVIFKAVACVAEAKLQSAIMVPTEILAEQHYRNAINLLGPLGIRIALLTSQTSQIYRESSTHSNSEKAPSSVQSESAEKPTSPVQSKLAEKPTFSVQIESVEKPSSPVQSKSAEKQEILQALLNEKIDLVIGTHALIEDYVSFAKLAFVVIDEQHRFGVGQRQKLKDKAMVPHFLMVTATPIPRTLAMTAYGDLDLSFIKQKPPGRMPIETKVIDNKQRKSMLNFLFSQVQKGRQAYIIFPLVEESEKMPLKDVVSACEQYKAEFPQISWGLLHGQMKGDEKKQVMQKFKAGEFQVLLSTTVVEVGVDVPNANLIIVEHAERFGLSQLHQLRGRVGRGQHKSYCVFIMSNSISLESKNRLSKLETTNDGFELAEWDLELRGPGEFTGTRQSGLTGFNLAHIIRDFDIFEEARNAVLELIEKDPQLKWSDHSSIKSLLNIKEKNFSN